MLAGREISTELGGGRSKQKVEKGHGDQDCTKEKHPPRKTGPWAVKITGLLSKQETQLRWTPWRRAERNRVQMRRPALKVTGGGKNTSRIESWGTPVLTDAQIQRETGDALLC
jgi:hypothetical protein